MLFFVLGVDGDDVQERLEALSEAHWSYLDGFADALVARGPTLSADGELHTGSVHVVEVTDRDAAQRFAVQEPFCRAGLYSSVTVTRCHDRVGGTMWERPAAPPGVASALVLATWSGEPAPGDPAERWQELTRSVDPDQVVFGGLLLSDDAANIQGLVLAVDLPLPEAGRLAAELTVPPAAAVSVQRWQRGGRPADR